MRVGRLRVDLGKGSSGRVTTWQKSAISRTLPIGDFRRMTAKSAPYQFERAAANGSKSKFASKAVGLLLADSVEKQRVAGAESGVQK